MAFFWLGYAILLLLGGCCTAQEGNEGCASPPRRVTEELADSSIKSSYSNGDIVVYNCRPGHIKVGRIRFICTNGNWEQLGPVTQCRKKPCGHPGDIQYGSFELVRGEELVFGARVEYHCDEGYQMLSQTNYRDCQTDGWSNDVPHCEVRKCLPVSPPENGRIVMTGIHEVDQVFLFGQVVQFECNANFKVKGEKQIVCTTNGKWSAPEPTCEEIACRPDNIDNGRLTSLNRVYRQGERMQYSCSRGYKPAERTDAACTENGWNPKPQCVEITCRPPELVNGNYEPKLSHYDHEDIIDLTCNAGYQLQNRKETATCTETGWMPFPSCISKTCDMPHIANGQLSYYYRTYANYVFPRTPGQTIDFTCHSGFLASDKQSSQRVTCTALGFDPEPKCYKRCFPPGHLQHGRLIYNDWNTFIEGDEISFFCEHGYQPDQETKAKCTKTGWSPAPRCVESTACQRFEVPNGFLVQLKRQFALQEKAKYRCAVGFITPSGLDTGETQCLDEGWSPRPECIRACQKPIEPNAKFLTTRTLFMAGESLVYECKEGYETSKRTARDQIVCNGNQWNPMPECSSIECGRINVEHISIKPEIKDAYSYGEVVQFACRGGRTRVGPVATQCYQFGWSPPPPVCKEQVNSCEPPTNIANGSLIRVPHQEYQHGDQVEYKCNLKFAMSGSKMIECVDGQWTSLPSCTEEEKTCELPPDIENGYPANVHKGPYLHGEAVSYECNENFVIVGANPAKCLHGSWEEPSCADGSAKCLQIPSNGNIKRVQPLRNDYDNNAIVIYTCESSQHKTKCANGKWSPKPECRALCPPPPQLPNAVQRTAVRSYENGERISFKCEQNFRLEGPEEIACVEGKWQKPPNCVDLRCGEPPQIANGAAENDDQEQYFPGEIVEYRCDKGFEIRGLKTATCQHTGWSQPPMCKEKICGMPPQVFHASELRDVKTHYQSGESMTYQCHPGFVADGPLIATCQRGQWTNPATCEDASCRTPPPVPNAIIVRGVLRDRPYLPGHEVEYQCDKGFRISQEAPVVCTNKQWIQPPVCEDITCPPPPEIPHGLLPSQQKERYLPSEKVRYRCERNWSLYGPPFATCSDKRWTEIPRCIDVGGKCGRPPPIENGDILESPQSEYMPGARVTYKCQNLYLVNGSAEIRCENGQWTEPPSCVEPCTVSEEDMRLNNIQPMWTRDSKLYSESGDKMTFACKRGYEPDPLSPPFRVSCIKGNVNYPRCVRQTH